MNNKTSNAPDATPAVTRGFMFHGGDYNPDQWMHVPGIVDEDFRLFRLAGINALSVGIFSWAKLEPQEGKFEFGWLDDIMDRAAKDGMAVMLATPSGGKPAWMSEKYPEILRWFSPAGGDCLEPLRQGQCLRHNHCPSSELYLEKCRIINRKLAERYAKHPALAAWHVSNEYRPGCQCEKCQAKFRLWLQRKYGTLENLNHAWWAGFWSHEFSSWEQIGLADWSMQGMTLDWRRFSSQNMMEFFVNECKPLREVTPGIPLTTNFMSGYNESDYWEWCKHVDFVTWDCYPNYLDREEDALIQMPHISMQHDLNRSYLKKPFLMLESSPGPTNWMQPARLLRPGAHFMKSMQAVAHGSDGVCYFQMRKGRGGCEQYHGAVIDHLGTEEHRMFKEVAQVGDALKKLRGVIGAGQKAQVGIIFDRQSKWTIECAGGPSEVAKQYQAAIDRHYRAMWRRGVTVDVLNGDSSFDGYDLVIAPELYMLRDGFGKRVEQFVSRGGVFVSTYYTGYVNETALAFLGGFPGPLRKVLGIVAAEVDNLRDDEANGVKMCVGNGAEYAARGVCELLRVDAADVVARYTRDFYADTPAITVNRFGKGQAWHIAALIDDESFYDEFYAPILRDLGIEGALPGVTLPAGVSAQKRVAQNGDEFIFMINYGCRPCKVDFADAGGVDILTGRAISGAVDLPQYGVVVLKR